MTTLPFRCLLLAGVFLTASAYPGDEAEALTLLPGDDAPPLQFAIYDGAASAPEWSQLRGRIAVLDFWASWCGPCIKAIPHMDNLKKRFADRPVDFFSITYETKAMVAKSLARHPMSSQVGMDRGFTTFKSYRAWGIPMIVLVDGQGKVAAVMNPKDLKAAHITALLGGETLKFEAHPGWPDPRGAEEYFRSLLEKE